MEFVAFYVERRHFLVGDLDALGIKVAVHFAENFEAGCGRGAGDQLDDNEQAEERGGAPILSDVAEHAVLDLVPLCAIPTYAEGSNAQESNGSCLKDDGWAHRRRLSGVGVKPPQAAAVKSRGGERWG